MNDEQWKTILSTITDPNKGNIIEKIQEALNEEGEHKKWQEAGFDVNHLFEVAFANGSKSKCTLLHLAAVYGHTETVNALLAVQGVEVNKKGSDGYTPLHLAAENGHTETVNALIDKDAEVNMEDSDGYTPLHCAARNGHTETVDTLIDKGASVNTVDRWQQTPLHLAACSGHIET
ncbi:MAG: ankyrin repeat domain-containing protein, partial [Wolbachia endosymbiont of Tyrophagus putrescentiae]|nr:ankyrin repeat domain-containing protein [Wolbachia endosymbiont of Tyrophagus putrescentiae]